MNGLRLEALALQDRRDLLFAFFAANVGLWVTSEGPEKAALREHSRTVREDVTLQLCVTDAERPIRRTTDCLRELALPPRGGGVLSDLLALLRRQTLRAG
jgi:hypothetical protein